MVSMLKSVEVSFFLNGSKFYVVHHHFKPHQAKAWWPIAQAYLSDENKYGAWVSASLEKGFFNHSFNPVATEGPIFCIWETREAIPLSNSKTSLTVQAAQTLD